MLLGFVTSMILARILPAKDMGAFFLAISFISIVVTIFSLGLPVTLVRKLSQSMAEGKTAQAKKIMLTCLVVSVVMGVLAYALTLLLGGWFAEHVVRTQLLAALMPQLGFLVFFALLRGVVSAGFRGLHDLRFATLFGGVLTSFLTASLLALLWWLIGASNIQQVLWISLASSGLIGIVALFFIFRTLYSLKTQEVSTTSSQVVLKEIFSMSWAMWLIGVLLFLLSNADLWIVSAFGSGEDVALYGMATRLTMLVTVCHTITVAVIQPVISELHAKNDMQKMEKVVRTMTTIGFVPALFVTIVLVLFSKELLSTAYGDYYANASHVLIILSLAHLFGMVVGPIGIIQMMTGLQIYFFVISAITGLLAVISAILIMPEYGTVGVACAWFVSGMFHGVINAWIVRLKLGIKCYISPSILFDLCTNPKLFREIRLMRKGTI